jgi:hypothetical protein
LNLRQIGSPDGKIPPETITDESPLIRNRHKKSVKPLLPKHIYKTVHNLYYRAGLLGEKKNRRYNLRVHSIRKFFRTQLSALGVTTDFIEYFMGHTLSTYCDIQMKGVEFLRNVYAASGLSIRPKTQQNKIEVLKEMVRAFGMNPEQVLTKEALNQPYAATNCTEEDQVKSLNLALKEIIKKELLNGKP